ncbi:MAG TPA: hypothetical protein VFT51_05965 [Bacillales bacterium]|nr:hypothetical protein [Bacillales bacterium]
MRPVWVCFALIGAFLSFMCFKKFSELKGITPDGNGIGVYFLGFPVNERLPNDKILDVANQFLGVSVFIAFLTLVLLGGFVFHKKIVRRWNSKNGAR